jgi:hypothetical protein
MGELLNLVGLSTGVVLYAVLFTMVVLKRALTGVALVSVAFLGIAIAAR